MVDTRPRKYNPDNYAPKKFVFALGKRKATIYSHDVRAAKEQARKRMTKLFNESGIILPVTAEVVLVQTFEECAFCENYETVAIRRNDVVFCSEQCSERYKEFEK